VIVGIIFIISRRNLIMRPVIRSISSIIFKDDEEDKASNETKEL